MSKTFFLDLPEHFSFKHTIKSHGWSDLLPFEIDEKTNSLCSVFSADGIEKPISAIITENKNKLEIKIKQKNLSPAFEKKILRDVRHILRLDESFEEFYALIKKEKRLAWISNSNAGRLLRSPTVFEDLVKTICTTNCSWALTKKMVTNLVEKLGEKTEEGKSAFPTAAAMASVSADFYKKEIRAGYRSIYFLELAEKVASGKVKPESWLETDLPTKELKKEMKKIKGVGDYAAENLLKLVARYDGLALDSWLRSQFYKKHNDGKVCADKEIEDFYASFREWRGLTIWCDMTEKWF